MSRFTRFVNYLLKNRNILWMSTVLFSLIMHTSFGISLIDFCDLNNPVKPIVLFLQFIVYCFDFLLMIMLKKYACHLMSSVNSGWNASTIQFLSCTPTTTSFSSRSMVANVFTVGLFIDTIPGALMKTPLHILGEPLLAKFKSETACSLMCTWPSKLFSCRPK